MSSATNSKRFMWSLFVQSRGDGSGLDGEEYWANMVSGVSTEKRSMERDSRPNQPFQCKSQLRRETGELDFGHILLLDIIVRHAVCIVSSSKIQGSLQL
jgi:hypothetical protein